MMSVYSGWVQFIGAQYRVYPCNIIPIFSLPIYDSFRDVLVLIFNRGERKMLIPYVKEDSSRVIFQHVLQ